jgi:LysM repeat protein
MVVWVEMLSKIAYINNGFFLDKFEVVALGEPTAQPTNTPLPATIAPPPTSTPAPTQAPAAVPTQPPAPAPVTTRYVVQRGDTLSAIARRYGLTTAALAAANGITNVNFIYSGQVLTIPAGSGPAPQPTVPPSVPPTQAPPPATGGRTYVVQRGDSLGAIARQHGVSVSALAAANNIRNANLIFVGQVLTIPGSSGGQSGRTYLVQRGDTLAAIAARFGTTVAALQAANNLSNINFIYSGQVLRIP